MIDPGQRSDGLLSSRTSCRPHCRSPMPSTSSRPTGSSTESTRSRPARAGLGVQPQAPLLLARREFWAIRVGEYKFMMSSISDGGSDVLNPGASPGCPRSTPTAGSTTCTWTRRSSTATSDPQLAYLEAFTSGIRGHSRRSRQVPGQDHGRPQHLRIRRSGSAAARRRATLVTRRQGRRGSARRARRARPGVNRGPDATTSSAPCARCPAPPSPRPPRSSRARSWRPPPGVVGDPQPTLPVPRQRVRGRRLRCGHARRQPGARRTQQGVERRRRLRAASRQPRCAWTATLHAHGTDSFYGTAEVVPTGGTNVSGRHRGLLRPRRRRHQRRRRGVRQHQRRPVLRRRDAGGDHPGRRCGHLRRRPDRDQRRRVERLHPGAGVRPTPSSATTTMALVGASDYSYNTSLAELTTTAC